MRRLRKPICLVAAIVILTVIMTGTVIYVKKTDQSGATYSNPLWEAPDPYVILHDGMYYRTYPAKGNQIVVAVSESLVTRGTPTVVYEFPSGNWNSTAVWAPLALFQWDDGHWYIYYCAVHNGNIDLYGHERRAGVLRSVSDDPMGPYEDLSAEKPINTGDCWGIGVNPFKAPDGKWYVTWSGLQNMDSMFPQCTYIAPMISPAEIGDRVLISVPDKAWECSVQPIQEGQSVFVKDGKMFLLYSGNASWTEEYCVGMLVNESGNVLDPDSWVKQDEPLLRKNIGVRGPGGPCIVPSKDGKEYYLMYHTTNVAYGGWRGRFTNALKVEFDKRGYPVFGEPLPYGDEFALPSGDPGPTYTKVYDNQWNSDMGFAWTTFGGEWGIEFRARGSRYYCMESEYTKCVADTVWVSDMELTTEMVFSGSDNPEGTAGVMVRVTRAKTGALGFCGYYVSVNPNQGTISISRVDQDKETVLATAPVDVKRFTEYELRVRTVGDEILVYFDQSADAVVSVKDATYAEGSVGIRAYRLSAKWGDFYVESVGIE